MVGCVYQENAGAIAVHAHAAQRRCKVLFARGMIVGHANDLQTVHFHLLIAQHAYSSGRNRVQIFAVVSKLLVIARDKVHALRRL